MSLDSMTDAELRDIQMHFPAALSLDREESALREWRVETGHGSLLVAVQGDRSLPAILTYHDLGLDHATSFQTFFNFHDMRALLENFALYHVTAPGQEEDAQPLPADYEYPTMDELAQQLDFVLSRFGLKNIIGFGVGVGANVLARFALEHPQKVEALFVVNCVSTQAGWIEWGYQKLNIRHLRSQGMTQRVVDYLMWHHFGRDGGERNQDLAQVYRSHFQKHVNPTNLASLIDSYIKRTDLNITREADSLGQRTVNTLSIPVMNVTGDLSPHVEDTVTLNGRLDPANCTWMKFQDCAVVLEEKPAKASEAFRLFLQGLGHALKVSRKAPSAPSADAKSN